MSSEAGPNPDMSVLPSLATDGSAVLPSLAPSPPADPLVGPDATAFTGHAAPLPHPAMAVLARAAVLCVAALLFAAPAVWNGFPFLFWDTGGYLEAGIHHAIVPGRSIVYGVLLSVGRWPDFWPVVALQCLLTAWMIALLFRVQGFGERRMANLATCAALAAFTALPFVAGELMPDIFAALAPLGLYLLLARRRDLGTWEMAVLVAVLVFAGGAHGSVMATLLVLFGMAFFAARISPRLRAMLRLRLPALTLVAALLVTPSLNLVLAGRFVPTPGAMAFVFGRLLQDGIIDRYLLEHCPDPTQPLCYYREELPSTADDFLWDNDDVFVALGGMERGIPAMRDAVVGALLAFPMDNLALAARAFARQLVTLETGDSLYNYLTDSTDAITALVPSAAPAMTRAWQQAWPGLDFTRVNQVQVPLALVATGLLVVAAAWSWAKGRRQAALLCFSVLAILLVNAAVCGILSNPVNRYQARVAWLAIPALVIAGLSASAASRPRWPGRP